VQIRLVVGTITYTACRAGSISLSVCPIIRLHQQHAARLLLSAKQAGDVSRWRQTLGTKQQWHHSSAADAGSAILTAKLTRLNTVLLSLVLSLFAAQNICFVLQSVHHKLVF